MCNFIDWLKNTTINGLIKTLTFCRESWFWSISERKILFYVNFAIVDSARHAGYCWREFFEEFRIFSTFVQMLNSRICGNCGICGICIICGIVEFVEFVENLMVLKTNRLFCFWDAWCEWRAVVFFICVLKTLPFRFSLWWPYAVPTFLGTLRYPNNLWNLWNSLNLWNLWNL